jgi:hypothetical protein
VDLGINGRIAFIDHKRVKRLYAFVRPLSTAPPTQVDSAERAVAADLAAQRQRGLVCAFRFRSPRLVPHAQVPGDRRRCHTRLGCHCRRALHGQQSPSACSGSDVFAARPTCSDRQREEITGKAMLTWAAPNGVTLRLIEPRRANQNACVNRSTDGCETNV